MIDLIANDGGWRRLGIRGELWRSFASHLVVGNAILGLVKPYD